ncbi:Glutamate 5-kinase 1 [Streptococcus sp. BCA20]|uniref:Glutamate 5-kinase n=1 Tax=Streptococcus intermedius TaxID=1338 RepID=A0AAD1C7T6_STRIT|nr:glutamate 5-kinase [Streptococcus intermedius]MDK8090508.1 glutamate 5-kinase [Streptococcus intermedius]PMR65979.1 glutamate 5-kinase [Streptococcus intermedius]RSJ00235.1 Glutamate 5-kinase 1 [Streptococcus sp. BCA20]BAW16841.1 glutamate 5-kinase [Streptococcus intermedius]
MFNRRDVPLINKNDIVFVVELKVSNNDDTLSTQIAFMVQAELLILLIDVDSFYTANPIHYPAAKDLNLIEKLISDSLEIVEAASLEADVFRGKIIKAVAVFYKRTQELEETEP